MDEPNAEKRTSLECTSIPGRSWPGASLYKSLKLGWHWRRLRRAVVAASEAAQGHEANGLPPGSREFKTLFDEVVRKVQEHSTESGDPIDNLKARLPALCALERLAYPAPTVPRNKAGLTLGILIAALLGSFGMGALALQTRLIIAFGGGQAYVVGRAGGRLWKLRIRGLTDCPAWSATRLFWESGLRSEASAGSSMRNANSLTSQAASRIAWRCTS